MKVKYSILTILIIIAIFLNGCSKEIDCREDPLCFIENIQKCTKSTFLLKDGHEIGITVRGVQEESCIVSFKVLKISKESFKANSLEVAELEGKKLNCRIPNTINPLKSLNESENIDHYCEGSIKNLLKEPVKDLIRREVNRLQVTNR